MSAARDTAEGVVLNVRVVPRASRTDWAGRYGDAFKIRLQAPPVDGKANKALLRFLSRSLGLPGNRIELLSGHTGRTKRILLRGTRLADIAIPA